MSDRVVSLNRMILQATQLYYTRRSLGRTRIHRLSNAGTTGIQRPYNGRHNRYEVAVTFLWSIY